MNRQMDWQTDRQANRQTDRWIGTGQQPSAKQRKQQNICNDGTCAILRIVYIWGHKTPKVEGSYCGNTPRYVWHYITSLACLYIDLLCLCIIKNKHNIIGQYVHLSNCTAIGKKYKIQEAYEPPSSAGIQLSQQPCVHCIRPNKWHALLSVELKKNQGGWNNYS